MMVARRRLCISAPLNPYSPDNPPPRFGVQLKKAIRMLNLNCITAKETDYVVGILGIVDSDTARSQAPGAAAAASNPRIKPQKSMSYPQFTVVAALSERVVALGPSLRDCILSLDMAKLEARYAQVIQMFHSADVDSSVRFCNGRGIRGLPLTDSVLGCM